MASSTVLKRWMDWTGPKISSRQIFMSSVTSANTVGSTKNPFSPCLQGTSCSIVFLKLNPHYLDYFFASGSSTIPSFSKLFLKWRQERFVKVRTRMVWNKKFYKINLDTTMFDDKIPRICGRIWIWIGMKQRISNLGSLMPTNLTYCLLWAAWHPLPSLSQYSQGWSEAAPGLSEVLALCSPQVTDKDYSEAREDTML